MRYTVFGVSFFTMWAAYIIGTVYPDTRGGNGPLTILAIVLFIGSVPRPSRMRSAQNRQGKGNRHAARLLVIVCGFTDLFGIVFSLIARAIATRHVKWHKHSRDAHLRRYR